MLSAANSQCYFKAQKDGELLIMNVRLQTSSKKGHDVLICFKLLSKSHLSRQQTEA